MLSFFCQKSTSIHHLLSVRATAVGWDMERDAVLAWNLKGLVYYVIDKLNKDIPSRGSEEERIRIHLRA